MNSLFSLFLNHLFSAYYTMTHPMETKVYTLHSVGQADVKGYTCFLELIHPASVALVKVCTG